jgi:RNA polymerase sigma-70 factor (ECF subfamily)
MFEEYSEKLRSYAKGILRDAELADEVVQNTFLKLSEQSAAVEIISIKAWLYKVALNEALTIKRRQNIDTKAKQMIGYTSRQILTQEDEIQQKELIVLLQKALETLPESQRIVVHKKYVEGKTFAVIAEELTAPLGTVLTRMRLAMKKLHQEMKIYFPECDHEQQSDTE